MQAAALLLAATYCCEVATTPTDRSYMLGVRDTLEAMFRAVYDLANEVCAVTAASDRLAGLSANERVDLLEAAQNVIYVRHGKTLATA